MTIKKLIKFIDEKLFFLEEEKIYKLKEDKIWLNNKYSWEQWIIDSFFDEEFINRDLMSYLSGQENDWVWFESKKEFYLYVIDYLASSFSNLMDDFKYEIEGNYSNELLEK